MTFSNKIQLNIVLLQRKISLIYYFYSPCDCPLIITPIVGTYYMQLMFYILRILPFFVFVFCIFIFHFVCLVFESIVIWHLFGGDLKFLIHTDETPNV